VRTGICKKCGTDRELFMNSQICNVCAAEKSRETLRVKKERRLELKKLRSQERDEAFISGKPLKKTRKKQLGFLDTWFGDNEPGAAEKLGDDTDAIALLVAAVVVIILFSKYGESLRLVVSRMMTGVKE